MKILVLSNLYPPDVLGGYEMGCKQAADALRTAGHEVVVLTSVPRAATVPAESGIERRLRLTDVYDNYHMWKTAPAVHAVRMHEARGVQSFNVHVLGQAIEEFQPDVVYAWNLIGLGGLGLLAAIQYMGVPWVMHLMDDVPRTLCTLAAGNSQAVPAVAETFSRVCRGRFICCSRITLDEIARDGVQIADRTTIIPNWVTTTGTPDRTDYRPGGHLRLVTAGSFGKHKGVDLIVRMAGLLRDRGHDNFSVDLYGMGGDPSLRTQIQSERLEMVTIRGFRTQAELDELYPNYDVFLFPTWEREPFGFAPLEAMAHGCLAVMSQVCGIAEWLVDGADCIKVVRNPVALADAVEAILQGRTPLAEIGPRGARTATTWFSLAAVLPKIEAELEAAVRAGGGPRRPAAEAHTIALLAEKMFKAMVYETAAA